MEKLEEPIQRTFISLHCTLKSSGHVYNYTSVFFKITKGLFIEYLVIGKKDFIYSEKHISCV